MPSLVATRMARTPWVSQPRRGLDFWDLWLAVVCWGVWQAGNGTVPYPAVLAV